MSAIDCFVAAGVRGGDIRKVSLLPLAMISV
jgi:hypothetical protein